jgi:opacity protein-like surface antigen
VKRLVAAIALAVALAVPARAADVGFDFRGSVVGLHYVQSGWKTPEFAVSEFALGPHVGGLYVGGVGIRQVGRFGTVIPLLTYVGQGRIPKLRFLRGVAVTFAVAHEGVFSGRPAYFFGLGIGTK